MSFVHPLSALGEPERRGVPSLRDIAAREVAQQLAWDLGGEFHDRYVAMGPAVDGPFQLARANAIAQEAAGRRRDVADGDYIDAYEAVAFSPPGTHGPKNAAGLTASMRARKRLTQPDLRDPYYAKLQRRHERRASEWDPLPGQSTPGEADQPPWRLPQSFRRFLFAYLGLEEPAEPVAFRGDAARAVSDALLVGFETADALVRTAWHQFRV